MILQERISDQIGEIWAEIETSSSSSSDSDSEGSKKEDGTVEKTRLMVAPKNIK